MINREWTQCEGKVAFHERQLAEKAAGRRPGRNAYKCEICRMYHVGTRTDGVKKSIRASRRDEPETVRECQDWLLDWLESRGHRVAR